MISKSKESTPIHFIRILVTARSSIRNTLYFRNHAWLHVESLPSLYTPPEARLQDMYMAKYNVSSGKQEDETIL